MKKQTIGREKTYTSLEVSNLAIGYHTKKQQTVVSKNLCFSLSEGELVAIVGINGIGKSTLLRTLGKVQPKLKGDIWVGGKLLKDMKPLQLAAAISVVLTEPIASKNMTVYELVALGRQPYTNWIGTLSPTDRSKIDESLQMLELVDLQDKKCYELSDGQLQRVMIARAIAQETAIILLDEPTTHLDLYHKVKILKLLKSIAQQTNKTILFTSHEIGMAIQLCDKILLLNDNNNPFGTPQELIVQQAFDRLFPSDTVSFDAKTGMFQMSE